MEDKIIREDISLVAKDNFDIYNHFEERVEVKYGDKFNGTRMNINGLELVSIELLGIDTVYHRNEVENYFIIKGVDK